MPDMDKETAETISAYTTEASEYIRATEKLEYFAGLEGMIDRFIDLLPGNRVLDVAFGSGRDILHFLNRKMQVEGLELAEKFIDILRPRVDVPLYHMDMRNLEFPSASFDGLWCCSAFLHVPREDALKTLQGFSRVLRPSGLLFLSLKEGEGEKWVKGGSVESPRYFVYYRTEEIRQLLLRSGFEVLYLEKQVNEAGKPLWISLICRKPAAEGIAPA